MLTGFGFSNTGDMLIGDVVIGWVDGNGVPYVEQVPVNPQILVEIVKAVMPFGKYKGRLIVDLPVYYLEWMHSKGGFPPGKMGMLLSSAYEIKTNGLNTILLNVKAAFNNGEF